MVHDDAAAPVGRIRRVAGVVVVSTAFLLLLLAPRGTTDDATDILLGFAFYLIAAFAIVAEARRVKAPLPPIPDRALAGREAGAALVLLAAGMAVSLTSLYLSVVALSWPFEEWVTTNFLAPDLDGDLPDGILLRALFAVETVALTPMVEELLFRGVMLHWWAPRWGLRRTVMVSALLFGVLHVDLFGSIVFALVATALYLASGTMLAPILFHALWNCVAIIGDAVAGGAADQEQTIAAFREGWYWAVLVLAASAAMLWGLLRRMRPAGGWTLPALSARD